MTSLFWFVLFVGGAVYLAYRRVSLLTFTVAYLSALLAYSLLSDAGFLWKLMLWLAFFGLVFLTMEQLRRVYISKPALLSFRRMLPPMSPTEREALEAGTVWWEGELFSGRPDWKQLMQAPAPKLTAEEQAFLDGPTEELCRMLDEWDITHNRADLPPEVWKFIKEQGFFAMVIPKKYGGLELSAYAHSCVLVKISSRSVTAASMIGVPNSLGPPELLIHYGTDEQKDHYLPALARGDEVPCFALTGPRAGSDATSIPDTGIVCKGTFEGKETLGIRLNWDKRYITLAPIATVLGLAFKLYDPDHLLGERKDYGITVALVPTRLPGITIGRRHFPLNVPFQNGPTQGKDVFVPLDYIVGGVEMAGQGWRMLVELLSAGRCISLPSNSTGPARAATLAAGAYSRIRRQFNQPIGRFEGVGQALARIAGHAYTMDAARSVTTAALDLGQKPSVVSAILKYHVTEMGRRVANDAMDVHGGKGICLGPRNYLGRGYQITPIAITVEGANILTRSLIIFGQGAVRCHPFLLREMNAARDKDHAGGLKNFDQALFGHIGYAISNATQSLVMALTHARYTKVPVSGATKRYYQHINRYSAGFALAADVAMLTLGGSLKKKERLSARLGDILSSLYLASMVLKHYDNQGRPEEDLPLVEWSCRNLLYGAQEQMHSFLRNFPNRWTARVLRLFIFPRGLTYSAPSDALGQKVVDLIINPSTTRERLGRNLYTTLEPTNPIGLLQEALELAVEVEPLEKRVRLAVKAGDLTALDLAGQIEQAIEMGVLSRAEGDRLLDYDRKIMEIIAVDDFDPEELGAKAAKPERAKKTKSAAAA